MLRDSTLIPLSHQHHNGLVLCVMTRRELGAGHVEKLARRVIDRFEIELVNHFEIEEQVLFPLSGDRELVDRLVAEHRAIEGIVEQLRVRPTAELLEQFCTILTVHIRLEESQLFEAMQRQLTRDALDQAGAEIERRVVRVCL